jgi:predicted nucleic acid-binding protein
MIILDTSAFISLSMADLMERVVEDYSVHTTQEVISELEQTAREEDCVSEAAARALSYSERIEVHSQGFERFETSRLDSGEASCIALTREIDADFILTDDLRAMAEIKKLSTVEVAISPFMIVAMVKNDVLSREEALNKMEGLAENRDWLGTPIYQRAKKQFENSL